MPELSINNGKKNKDSIIAVLATIFALAFLLILFDLKCVLTLFLNVLEKFELMSLENFGLSMLLLFFRICIKI